MRHARDWAHRRIPPLGTRVYDRADPRHVGRLTAVVSDQAVVTWEETGWRSTLRFSRLIVATEELS